MSFFRTAWHAGAAEYGRARAERYGKVAVFGAVIGWAVAIALVFGIYLAWNGLLGG